MRPEDDPGAGREDGRERPDSGSGPKKFHYFVDGEKYDSDQSALTGAQMKSQIPNFDPAYQLVLEGKGNDPDRVIADNESVSLQPPPHFYSAPPANFG